MTIILILILLLGVSTCASSDAFISNSALGTNKVDESHHSSGRALLQASKPCPVSFENQNYTIITSKCKGPKYPADICCGAFKDFACPFADELNDLSNSCAQTMFSYINLYGKYPPGLFSTECRDSKRGLECTAQPSNARATSAPHLGVFLLLSVLAFLSTSSRFF